jgi:Ca2+-binding RTX toxin-like protein
MLIGGDGNDTYVWARGDGNDVIDESGTLGGSADRLVLTGVSASQVSSRPLRQ